MGRRIESIGTLRVLGVLGLAAFGCGGEPPKAASDTAPPVVKTPETPTPTAPIAARKPALLIATSDDFEASTFCAKYRCSTEDSWPLRTGGQAHTYSTTLQDVGEELEVLQGRVVGLGLSFYERDRLGPDDLAAIKTWLKSADTNGDADRAVAFVKTNAERKAFQIRQGRSMNFGSFTLWAAKVGNDQVISLEREN